jgi:hypothetical protein
MAWNTSQAGSSLTFALLTPRSISRPLSQPSGSRHDVDATMHVPGVIDSSAEHRTGVSPHDSVTRIVTGVGLGAIGCEDYRLAPPDSSTAMGARTMEPARGGGNLQHRPGSKLRAMIPSTGFTCNQGQTTKPVPMPRRLRPTNKVNSSLRAQAWSRPLPMPRSY